MHSSVTAMATDSAATALSDAPTFTVMCTSLSRYCENSFRSAVSCHRWHTSVYSNVTTLSFSSLLYYSA